MHLLNRKSVSHALQILQDTHVIRSFARQEQLAVSVNRFARAPDRVRRHAALAVPQRLQDALIVVWIVGAERQRRERRGDACHRWRACARGARVINGTSS